VDVKISWTAPASTGGSGIAITAYRIEVLLKDGSFIQVCDGADPAVVANGFCTLPALSFLQPPFAFSQGDKIKARVAAINEIGPSDYSVVSNTLVALVQTVPHKPINRVQVD
jgi:transketolase C-terminal domain/subunit